MATDANFWSFITDAGLVVKIVMTLLMTASVISWAIILQRAMFLKKARVSAALFENNFWSGADLNQLYNGLSQQRQDLQGLENIFFSGFDEFIRLRQRFGARLEAIMEGVQRAMRIAQAKEMDKLESHLTFLATVGSISPYVGLFGTVWGIMTSFQALGHASQLTIAMVAPGISEALIATAMGLFAAIPAVIAYNRYSSDVERLANQYYTFLEEFTSILHRQALPEKQSLHHE